MAQHEGVRLERTIRDRASGYTPEVVRAEADDGQFGDDLVHLRLEPEEILRGREARHVPGDDADEPHQREPAPATRFEWHDEVLELLVNIRVGLSDYDPACPAIGREVATHLRFDVS